MKKAERARRQIFVFTAEEKRAAICVLAAFLLGLVTMHYRATHPRETVKLTPKQEYAATRAKRASNARARSAHAHPIAQATPATEPETDDE